MVFGVLCKKVFTLVCGKCALSPQLREMGPNAGLLLAVIETIVNCPQQSAQTLSSAGRLPV